MPTKLQSLPDDIAESLKKLPEQLACVDGLVALWLFGSFARGEATPVSDVDLAYLPDEALRNEALERFETTLYVAIADSLHTDEFTFVNLRTAPAFIGRKVLEEGKKLFCRDSKAVAEAAESIYCYAPDVGWLRRVGGQDFLEAFVMANPEIDRDRVTELLRLINEDVQALREKARVSKQVYVRSRDLQAIVERRLQTATEGAISIGNHLVARLGLRAPQDYADLFRVLGQAQVLPWPLAEQMMDMARFRNLLVHVYWAIDHERVYDGLPGRIASLQEFAQQVARWLKGHRDVETF